MAKQLPRFRSRAVLKGAALLALPALMGAAFSVWPAPEPTLSSSPYASNPPLGHTGGFGEPTCRACHTDAALNDPDATLAIDGLPEQYTSVTVYRITVSVTGSGQGSNGFQASIRFAEGPQRGLQAGYLSAIDSRVVVGSDTLTAVQYAVHTAIGAEPVAAERGEWVVEWTSPRSGDAVVLHVAGNSANGDNSPFGDLIHTLERTSAGPTP